jgi:hypothetical protein
MATMKSSRNLRKEAKADAETTGVIAGIGAKVQVLEEKDGMTKVKLLATAGDAGGLGSPRTPSTRLERSRSSRSTRLRSPKNAGGKRCIPVRMRTIWRPSRKCGQKRRLERSTGKLAVQFHRRRMGGQPQESGRPTDPGLAFEFEVGDIDSWRMQCAVFALMAANKTDELTKAAGDKRPSAVDLLIAQSGLPAATDARDELIKVLKAALDATRTAMIEAGADLLVDAISSVTPTNDASAKINFGKVPAGREEIAKLIVSRFRDAGYGRSNRSPPWRMRSRNRGSIRTRRSITRWSTASGYFS